MRISKLLPAVCAAAFCASFLAVRAEDNPAKPPPARRWKQKMSAVGHATGATNRAGSPPQRRRSNRPAAPRKRRRLQPAAGNSAGNGNRSQAAARAALMQKTNATNCNRSPAATGCSHSPPAATGARRPIRRPAQRRRRLHAAASPPAQTSRASAAPRAKAPQVRGSSLFAPVPPPSGGIRSRQEPRRSNHVRFANGRLQTPAPAGGPSPCPRQPSQNNNAAAISRKGTGLEAD